MSDVTLAGSLTVESHESNSLPFGRIGVADFESRKQVSIQVPKTGVVTRLIGLVTDKFQKVPPVKS